MHAKIENGVVVEYPIINLRQRLPDASLPEDLTNDAALPEGYVYVRAGEPPQYDAATQRIESIGPVLNGDLWFTGYAVVDMTTEEVAAAADARKKMAYESRRVAYQQEADPLFFKAQRGEATMDDWLAKVAEIKARIF